ncbi:MAG: Type 1 glutamine amidotransferase-like domain-containing protein [Candidatus Uhrbacteria bacterium]|nr:Type 1 glutamine amidotransferase-like domain-containing protein [Candidatus Uhrbacteria bacterium]
MRRLFLASAFGDVAQALPWGLVQTAHDYIVGFVKTAANPYKDAWWVVKDKKKLQELGFVINEIDIEGMEEEDLRTALQASDILFVAGGNTFHLLFHAVKSGFDTLVKEFVDSGKVYIGSSAGSVIVGPILDPIHDLDEAYMVPELTSYNAFHIIDTVILPHTGAEFGCKNEKIKEEFAECGYPIVLLTDNQALVVEGDTEKIIEVQL